MGRERDEREGETERRKNKNHLFVVKLVALRNTSIHTNYNIPRKRLSVVTVAH